eukprot:2267558-Alexandrium_andersonii.AAC.1
MQLLTCLVSTVLQILGLGMGQPAEAATTAAGTAPDIMARDHMWMEGQRPQAATPGVQPLLDQPGIGLHLLTGLAVWALATR